MKKYYFNGQEIPFSEPYQDKGFRSGTEYWIKTYPENAENARNHELMMLKAVASSRGVIKYFEAGTVTIVSEDGHRHSHPAIKEEYLGGLNIKKYCADHFSDTVSILELFVKLAQALEDIEDKAHVIHNDIKSENILMHNGNPIIIDFGISKEEDEETTELHRHFSDKYEAPEKRERGEVTIRSDIYSFGRVIAWCVSQNPNNYKDFPDSLKEIKEKCCQKEPAMRYASFKEVKESLSHLLDSYKKNEIEKAESKKRRKDNIHKILSLSGTRNTDDKPSIILNLRNLAIKYLPFVTTLLYAAGVLLILLTLYLVIWGPTPQKGYIPDLKQDITTVVNDIQKNR